MADQQASFTNIFQSKYVGGKGPWRLFWQFLENYSPSIVKNRVMVKTNWENWNHWGQRQRSDQQPNQRHHHRSLQFLSSDGANEKVLAVKLSVKGRGHLLLLEEICNIQILGEETSVPSGDLATSPVRSTWSILYHPTLKSTITLELLEDTRMSNWQIVHFMNHVSG